MIREFRAYDIQKHRYWNDWSYNYLLSLEGVLLEVIRDEDQRPCPEAEQRFIFEQWTGLVDKNGTKVFEGDICRAVETANFYSDDKPESIVVAITITLDTPLSYRVEGGPDGSVTYTDIEVLGNIHENPELLAQCENAEEVVT